MHKTLLILMLMVCSMSLYAQTGKDPVLEKAIGAIKLMDDGQYDESIKILKECKKLDADNYLYPYEIALAYTYMKKYELAIKELKQTAKLADISSDVYQLMGNAYSYDGQKEKAIKSYKKGLKLFPDAANLYLEIGNIYLQEQDYETAIEHYEKGIEVDPMFPSNYYRLADLYLNSTNKVPGLIYGELFMNIERTTARTQEMSELLYNTYASSIQFSEDSTTINFCKVVMVMDKESFDNMEDIQWPYCATFEQNMIIAAAFVAQDVNLGSLSDIRSAFIEIYYQKAAQEYPVVLYDYHKEMIEQGVFDAYNHYLFQIGNEKAFEAWLSENRAAFDRFVDWYTQEENIIDINKKNKYIKFK